MKNSNVTAPARVIPALLGVLAFLTADARSQSLLHYWKLDGDLTDSAGSADGSKQGAGAAAYVTGQFGQAVSLDGVDDYISTTTGTIVPATDYTLTAWVYWEAGNGSRGYIAGAQNGGTEGEVFTMSRSADGSDRKLFLNLLVNGGQGNSITESLDGTISDNAWQHVAYTVDSVNGTKIYLNGMVVGMNVVRTTHDPGTTLFNIGNNPDTGAPNPFDGLIDDVAIFSGVLDSTQISNVIASGADLFAGTPSALVSHWKLDDTSGSTAADSAGSSPGTFGLTASPEPSDPTPNQPGVFGTAFSFNAAEFDRLTIDNFAPFGSLGQGTISGWFKTSGTARAAILSYGEGALGADRLVIELTDGELLRLVIREGDTNLVSLETTATYNDNAWHHFAYMQDGTGITLYIDGSEVTSFTDGAGNQAKINSGAWFDDVTGIGRMTIGYEVRSGPVEFPFGGSLDDLAVFNRVLTTDELANVINAGAGNFSRDNLAPAITNFRPDPGESGVYPGVTLEATFTESIALKPGGKVTIRNRDDGSGSSDLVITLPDPQVSVSGSDLIIDPGVNLAFDTRFAVWISTDAIEDFATTANAFAGINDDSTWAFTTAAEDLSAPVITVKSPADNVTEVPRNTDIVATFDENILAGSGNIIIDDLLDGSSTQTYAVTNSSVVTIAGNVLTIDPEPSLQADRNYAIHIAAGAVRNFSDVDFAGIAEADDTTWNFQTKEQGPNVVLILGDDQAWYDYSFMRRPGVEQAAINMNSAIYQVANTPSIDRLVDEGVTFTHGYTLPVCRPSLASLITGEFPHRTLITGNDLVNGSGTRIDDSPVEARMQVLNPLPRTLASQLGYASFQTGKWWEDDFANGGFTAGDTVNSTAGGTAPSQWSAGKPSYVSARPGDWGLMTGRVDYVNDVAAPDPINYANTVETVTDYIDAQVTAEQPFFMWYAPFLPHTPHDPPASLLSAWDTTISEPNESGDFFAKYYANIARFDGGVGAILDHLDGAGIADNTIVILICDNGWINRPNASAFDVRSKTTPYEGGIRTPIIIRWPDQIKPGGIIEPSTVVTTPVSLVDVAPTVHNALGVAPFPEMTGVNLLDLSAVASRDTVFAEDSTNDIFDLNDPSQALEARVAIRDGWKLILFTSGIKELYHLYDTSTGDPVDPHETTNLAASNPELVSALTTAIVNWYAVDPNDFDSWIADPAFDIDLADQGFLLDLDGDHLPNGLEAWFGTNPTEFSAGFVAVSTDGTTSSFSHPKNFNTPDDLSGSYQWSLNLEDWYAGDGVDGPLGGPTVTISSSVSGSTATVTATASEALSQLYLRVVVSQG